MKSYHALSYFSKVINLDYKLKKVNCITALKNYSDCSGNLAFSAPICIFLRHLAAN